MSNTSKPKQILGRAEMVSFPDLNLKNVPARIDTGARTSSVWASNIREQDGLLTFVLFDKSSPLYDGKTITKENPSQIVVASSNGQTQVRYRVLMTLKIRGRQIKTYCTLADRSTQAYPLLVGRNTLKGKFIVDVQLGSHALDKIDQARYDELQSNLTKPRAAT